MQKAPEIEIASKHYHAGPIESGEYIDLRIKCTCDHSFRIWDFDLISHLKRNMNSVDCQKCGKKDIFKSKWVLMDWRKHLKAK